MINSGGGGTFFNLFKNILASSNTISNQEPALMEHICKKHALFLSRLLG
jgi:hypothetical protein